MSDAPAAPRPAPGKRISLALAVLMHVALAALLIYGVHWQTKTETVVAVDLVRAPPVAVPPTPTLETKPEPKPEPPPPPPPKPEPKPEPPKPAPKPDIAQKEKPKPEPKPAPKPEPKPEPKPVPDPFADQLRREAEALQQRRAADAAARELEELRARQTAVAQAGEIDRYIAAIRGKVRGNIVMPPGMRGNPEAVFEVTQLPSGEILNVRLKQSSGNPAWDAATERAIHKSSPLPKPARSELFNRTLELKFRPQDE